ncbi:MAG: aromatic ring-hydroxylating dioxygenase subunit alpha [Steroidobacteraceae bacterium]
MNVATTPLPSPIPLSQFEASAHGAGQSLFFPAEAYTSEAFYRFERSAVWMKEWIAVGRVEEIPADGDYFSISIAGEPIVMIRVGAEILAVSAVCRHRGMLLVQGSGNCKGRFVCPYHRWTYDRRGKLVGAPDMQGVKTFTKDQLSLPSLQVSIWCGIIFVNFDENAAPLTSRLAPLDPYVANWHLEDLKSEGTVDAAYRTKFDYSWNWKVYAEGQSECYHCDKLHGGTPTMAALDFGSLNTEVMDAARGVFAFSMRGKFIDNTLNHTGKAIFPAIPGLTEQDRWTSRSIIIAPNVFMQLMADSVILLCWIATGAQTMQVKRHRLYPPATLSRPDFLERHAEERAAARFFVEQDDVAFQGVQVGLNSVFAPRGPISGREPVIAGLNQWLLARYQSAASG